MHLGELVQMDGSHHAWFEDRGLRCCLMVMVDDATERTLAWMSGQCKKQDLTLSPITSYGYGITYSFKQTEKAAFDSVVFNPVDLGCREGSRIIFRVHLR